MNSTTPTTAPSLAPDRRPIAFTTRSGSRYELRYVGDLTQIRRTPQEGHEKRADSEWLTLHWHSALAVGFPVVLEIESLAGYGPDDHGNTPLNAALHPTTARTTSQVTHITYEDEGRPGEAALSAPALFDLEAA